MNPATCRLPYLPTAKRSIPLLTYLRQRVTSLPATRLHSMIACGSWSLHASRMARTYMGMSVRPSGTRLSGVERLSVPGATSIFGPRPPAGDARASRIPSRKCSLSATSGVPGRIGCWVRARSQPRSIILRIVATLSQPISRVPAARMSFDLPHIVTLCLSRSSWSTRHARHRGRPLPARNAWQRA